MGTLSRCQCQKHLRSTLQCLVVDVLVDMVGQKVTVTGVVPKETMFSYRGNWKSCLLHGRIPLCRISTASNCACGVAPINKHTCVPIECQGAVACRSSWHGRDVTLHV